MVIEAFFVHTAEVQTFKGTGPRGDLYGDAVHVACFLDDGAVLTPVAGGEQMASKTVLFAALSDADKFVPQSRVTCNGRAAQVVTVRRRDSGPLGLPDHVEVDLT